MKRLFSQVKHSILSLALIAAFAAPNATAATITVNPMALDEAVESDGKCSLREAVLSVDAVADQGGCVADQLMNVYGTDDTIILPAGTYRLTVGGLDETAVGANESAVTNNTPDASIGDLDLLHSVKIIGAGSGSTRIEWDPAEMDPTKTDRIFHIYTTDAGTANVNVEIQGVTLASGKTFEVDLGANTDPVTFPNLHYYLRRAGGALALGAAANVVEIDTSLTGAENANAGGLGGSTGGESGATSYTLALSDVVVDGSTAQGDGGGLYIAAPTMATELVVSNNKSATNGGGIYNEGATNIELATFSGNTAEGGGGIFTTGATTVNIRRSTFVGNKAIGGGAISNRKGVTINMENSTLSGNIGRDVGAGLYTNGAVNLNFVTVANNIAGADSPSSGSGINTFPAGQGAIMTLKNVLLADNKKGLNYDPLDPTTDPLSDSFVLPDAMTIAALPDSNCGTTSGGGGITVTSSGYNLSGDDTCNSNTTVLWFDDTSDRNSTDPMIGPLADNGGPTMTHALLAGSPALGKGGADPNVTVDQRGITRDATPDIGAYEVPTPPVVPSSSGGGGCSFNPNAAFDPGLLTLLGIAIGGLFMRRHRKDTSRHS